MISIRRAVAVIASRNRTIWHPNTRIEQSYLSTKAVENKVVDYSKPTKIPYQASNSVNLTGFVDKPVRLMTFPNGEVWGATTISQIPFLPSDTRIPVIFEGDMACIAACHLKQNVHVRLGGQLMADSATDYATQGNANVRVMVRSIKFFDTGDESLKDSVENPSGKP